ncbi:MAG TPA: type VII secretion integral membrane protein EccD [Pseudonocardiaceae bacterium]
MTVNGVGLVRITVTASNRRMDLALPEDAVVAEIIPGLLARAGEALADHGIVHGGWVLRRFDGTPLANDRTFRAYRVRDGEVLRLVPRRQEWPELDYDDLVDAIATSSRRRPRWASRYTRIAGLGLGAAVILLGLLAVAQAGPDWSAPSRWALGQAVLLLIAGIVLARVVGDAKAGAVVGLAALPYGFAWGLLSQLGTAPLTSIGTPQLLVGCAALASFGTVGYAAVGQGQWLFAGGAATGLFGAIGTWVGGAFALSSVQVAAILVGLLLPASPLFGSLAIRLAKLPLPMLPRSTADLVRDDPQPPRRAVHQAVTRADALLTGMLTGAAVVCAVGMAVLLAGGALLDMVLALVAAAGFLLRARLHPLVRQRVPLLLAGLTAPVSALLGLARMNGPAGLMLGASGLVAVGALAIGIGMIYSRRGASPYLGRSAEIVEILVILAVLPLACSVLGLYGWLRGLGG